MKTAQRILVVDDSPTVLEMVRHLLESTGYEVLTASDGLSAMNTAFQEAPDLIIADVEMPEITGLQLCRLLKGDPRTCDIPFLILSVRKEQYEQFWGRETGADDYLPKPFTPDALLARVRDLLARSPRRDRAPAPGGASAATRVEALEQVNTSLERRLFELTVVHGISTIAATAVGVRDSAQAILERLARLLDFRAAALTLSDSGASFVLVRQATAPESLGALHAASLESLSPKPAAPPPPVLLAGAELISPHASDNQVSMAVHPLRSLGRPVGVLCVAREPDRPFGTPELDLIDLVGGQAALVLASARLAEAERQQAEQLRLQNEELQRLNRTITDMISTVTHDLRTPLSSILGYVELAQEGATAQQREFLEVAHRNAERILHMVNNLLDISRLESGRTSLQLRPTSVAEVVLEVLLSLRPTLQERKQSAQTHLPPDLPPVLADPERLHEILSNLLTNASKYTPEGGQILVCAQREGDRVRVSVHDTGIGLSEEEQAQVFRKFFRARRPETSGIAGTGLGLAIVKTLVELHGGEVFVESKLNEGSTFGFTLPAALAP